jgi:hypothetical protein
MLTSSEVLGTLGMSTECLSECLKTGRPGTRLYSPEVSEIAHGQIHVEHVDGRSVKFGTG